MPKKKPIKKKASSTSRTPEKPGGVGGTDCIACSGTGNNSRGSRCLPCNGTGKRNNPLSTFSGGEKKEEDLSMCSMCSKGSLYNLRTKRFVGYCAACWEYLKCPF